LSIGIAGVAYMLDRMQAPDAVKVRKILARARIVPIDKTEDGAIAVVRGTVAPLDGELIAPISGRRCVCWLVVFDEVGSPDFVELGRSQEVVPFLVRSAEGTARVVPERAVLGPMPLIRSMPMPLALHSPPGLHHPDPVIELALRICTLRPNHLSTQLRATEYAIAIDAEVTVQGHVAHEADPDGAAGVVGYRNALPIRPVLSGSRRRGLLIG